MNNLQITVKSLSLDKNISLDAIRGRMLRAGIGYTDSNRVLTPEEVAQIIGTKDPLQLPAPKTDQPITKPAAKKKPSRWINWVKQIKLTDLIIWSEIGLGTYSLAHLAGVSGAAFGLICLLTYEYTRRTVRRPMRTVEHDASPSEHAAALEYNTLVQRHKAMMLRISFVLAASFCFANANEFTRAISVNTSIHTIVFDALNGINAAQITGTAFAAIISTIAYVLLSASSIEAQIAATA